jgi:hypothetical protein
MMIWQLANMPAPADLATLLSDGRVSWVSIKVLDGPYLYNAKGGNQKLLKEYWAAIQSEGIEVGGWHYVYGDQPGAEGDAAAAFYEEFKPTHWLIDAESQYKGIGMSKKAKLYCDKLHDGQVFTALCSYRFPSQHGGLQPFPFSAFLNHEKVDGTAPQVYWVGAQNPQEQTQASQAEYRKLTSKPFIPIGSAFKHGTWEPSIASLGLFRDWCKQYPAYGYYSLDYILKNSRWDMWKTITDTQPPIPLPPELSDHEKITRLWQYAQEQGWDV